MRLTSITIENFRGIHSLEMDDFRRVNLLVGQNGSGKTSVLEAIFAVSAPNVPAYLLGLNNLRGIESTTLEQIKLYFHNLLLNSTSSPHIKCTFTEPYQVRTWTLQMNMASNLSALSSSPGIIGTPIKVLFSIADNDKNVKKKSAPIHYTTSLVIDNQNTIQSEPSEKYTELLLSYYLSPALPYKYNVEFLKKIKIEKKTNLIVDSLTKIDSRIKDLELVGDELYCDIGLNQLMPVNITGDGIRKIITILSVIHNLPNGIVFFDEIENGLHYSSLFQLWKSALYAARQNNVQIFATTHSYDCIRALYAAEQELGRENGEDDMRVYRIENDDEKHTAVEIVESNIGIALERNWELR